MLQKAKEAKDARKKVCHEIVRWVKVLTGRRIKVTEAEALFEYILKYSYETAAESGEVRLPGGLGCIKKVLKSPIQIKTTYGEVLNVPERFIVKFVPGYYQKNLAKSVSSISDPLEPIKDKLKPEDVLVDSFDKITVDVKDINYNFSKYHVETAEVFYREQREGVRMGRPKSTETKPKRRRKKRRSKKILPKLKEEL